VKTGPRTVSARIAATAWLNAAIASSQDPNRPALFRTLAVEFYSTGVQLVGCDGTMLFRTWAPYTDIGDLPAVQPHWFQQPDDQVVVLDDQKFALGFMRTLLSAGCDDLTELTLSIERADREEEPPLGEELSQYVLTLQALGQQLSCKLYDGEFPDWRRLKFGLDPAELVDGMALATRVFQAVGKLKGTIGFDCTFRGDERAVEISSYPGSVPSLQGLLMPMRRPQKEAPRPKDSEQLRHDGGGEPMDTAAD
jgi:hypothetical protein